MGWLRPLLCATIIASSAFQIAKHFLPENGNVPFWDLHVYVRALDSPNPYDPVQELLFVYAPMVGDTFRLAGTHLYELLVTGYVLALIWFAREFARLPLAKPGAVFLVALSTGGMGTVSLMSGNVTAFMHLALLAMLMRAHRQRSTSWPWLALVGVFTIVKPYFLVFAPLALLLSADRMREMRRIATVTAAVTLVYGVYFIWRGDEMRAFRDALEVQLVEKGDYGSSVFAMLVAPFGSTVAALAFGVFLGSLVAIAFRLRRSLAIVSSSIAPLLVAYALLCLVNPRAHVYDLFPALLCIVMALDLVGWNTRTAAVVLGASLAGAVPALISEFARDPARAPAILLNYTAMQLIALGLVLAAVTVYLPMQKRSKM